jgi:hypothetical protein
MRKQGVAQDNAEVVLAQAQRIISQRETVRLLALSLPIALIVPSDHQHYCNHPSNADDFSINLAAVN